MATPTLAKRLRERRKNLGDTEEVEGNSTLNDTLDDTQTFDASQELPSDAEIEEAENLKKDLTEKHKEKRRELSRQYRSSSKEDLRSELKTAKARSKAKLEQSLRPTSVDAGDAIEKIDAGKTEAEVITEQPKSRKRRPGKKKEEVSTIVSADDGGVAIPELADKEDDGSVYSGDYVITPEEDAALKRSARRGTRGKSLAASMREKMLAKRAAEKAQKEEEEEAAAAVAEEEEEGDEDRIGRRFRGQRDTMLGTRFDDTVADEDTFRMRSARREKEKEMTIEELREAMSKRAVTEEEAVDFFTRVYEKEPDAEPKPPEEEGEGPKEEEEGEQEATESRKGDEEPLLISQRFKSTFDFVGVGAADYIPQASRIEKETDIFYTPAVAELPMERKIEAEPRNVEDEGLYVGERPVIAERNRLRLENRLVQERSLNWFGEDGKITLLPNPLKEIPYRPVLWDDQDNPVPEELSLHFVRAIPMEMGHHLDPSMGQRWQLEIDVHSVIFTHHHLFSREHVHAQRLCELMERYDQLTVKDNVEYCGQRIAALKRAVGNLQNQISAAEKVKGREDLIQEMERRVRDYRQEIQKTRATKLSEEGNMRSLVSSIHRTWAQLKRLRADTGCTNTPVKMEFKKETYDKETEEAEWRDELEEEVLEERLLREESYVAERKLYEEQLTEYTKQQEKKKAAQTREDRRRRAADEVEEMGHEEEDADMEAEDLKVLAEADFEEPTEPLPFDEEAVRERILAAYKQHRRPPGKARLVPILQSGATLTPDSQCDRRELQRRNDFSRFRYFIKVFFNYKEVCVTDMRELGSDFSISYTTILPVQIVQYPEIIHLQIFEKVGFSSHMLAEVYVPTPDHQMVGERARVEGFDFSSLHRTSHNHAGVGSGPRFRREAEGDEMVSLFTSGKVFAAAAWSVDENGQPMAPSLQESLDSPYAGLRDSGDPVSGLGASSLDDIDKVIEFMKNANLDPNDPADARVLQLLQTSPADLLHRDGRVHAPQYFRLDHLQEEFSFASEHEINSSNRYRLIMYRDQERPDFRNMVVPATEKEVSPDIFKRFVDPKDVKEKTKRPRDQVRGFEARKIQHEEFIQRVRAEVMTRFRQALHQKSLKEVVIEEEIPAVTNIIPTLMKLGEIERPLKPIREERKKVPAQNISQMQVEVLVSISSAINVPTRTEEPGMVNPLVEVTFQDQSRRTPVSDGPNPSFNSEFHFKFRAPPDATSLDTVGDVLDISIFDEMVFDVQEDDRQRGSSVHQRIERHWLGSISIPFPTIYLNTKVDGKFALFSPPSILGYTLPRSDKDDNEPGKTMLSFFITLEPAIQPPEPMKERDAVRFESAEEESLLTHAEVFTADFEKSHKNRVIKTTVVDMHCNEVFVTRYITPLNPPQEILDMSSERDEQMFNIARYVSLIPFVSDSLAFPGLCDIWSSCDQFLKMLAGDEEEHAVLLCNYFLHVFGDGGGVFLALGNAIPEGCTAYVLTTKSSSIMLWDSATGKSYNVSDVNCPMRSVGCIVNGENIWANIQGKDQPWEMRFDTSNQRDWRPIFGGKYRCPQLSSIQPSRLTYIAPDQRDIDSLKFQIDNTLRERFMAWRKGQITRWHYEFMRDIGEVLENLEKNGGRVYSGLAKKFEKYSSRYTLFGFPLNLPYTEMERIVEIVKSTGVHTTTARRVDFAISVYVKSYANAVISIWIYVASLINKTNY